MLGCSCVGFGVGVCVWVEVVLRWREWYVVFYKWWLSELQMFIEILEIHDLLLWRRFKTKEEACDTSIFRKKSAWQLLHHLLWVADNDESLALSRSRRLSILGAL